MVTPERPAMQVSSQKSQVPNTEMHIYSLQTKTALLYHDINHTIVSITLELVFRSGPEGYSSNHSSLTDLSHRRSASGGSASTGIGSILEPGDQQGESRTTPPVPAACSYASEYPSTPVKAPR